MLSHGRPGVGFQSTTHERPEGGRLPPPPAGFGARGRAFLSQKKEFFAGGLGEGGYLERAGEEEGGGLEAAEEREGPARPGGGKHGR